MYGVRLGWFCVLVALVALVPGRNRSRNVGGAWRDWFRREEDVGGGGGSGRVLLGFVDIGSGDSLRENGRVVNVSFEVGHVPALGEALPPPPLMDGRISG